LLRGSLQCGNPDKGSAVVIVFELVFLAIIMGLDEFRLLINESVVVDLALAIKEVTVGTASNCKGCKTSKQEISGYHGSAV